MLTVGSTTEQVCRKKRYWLRGGVVGASLVILLFLANYVGALIHNAVEGPNSIFSGEYPMMFPFILGSRPFIELCGPLSELVLSHRGNLAVNYAYVVVLDSLFFFVFGAIVGAIVGKTKRR
jgi:hypothetical protein